MYQQNIEIQEYKSQFEDQIKKFSEMEKIME